MGKYLEALKELYGDGDKNIETPISGTDKTDKSPFVSNVSSTPKGLEEFTSLESIPFTDHEIAEHKINQLKLRDDRIFIRRCLVGAYGEKRLLIVSQYFEEWDRGKGMEKVEHRKENVGRNYANTWLRNRYSKESKS